MRTINESVEGFLEGNVVRLAWCYKLVRPSGTTLYLTDHDYPIIFGSDTYSPIGSFDASAHEEQSGLRSSNLEGRGTIMSGVMSHDDLRAGRYDDTEVTVYLVDWKFPYLGALIFDTFWIDDMAFESDVYILQLRGLSRYLDHEVNAPLSRTCVHTFGVGICALGITLSSLEVTGRTVSTIVTQRSKFTTNVVVGDIDSSWQGANDDYWKRGILEFTSGNNQEIPFDIKALATATGEVELYVDTPFDIAVSDEFKITPGCRHTAADCKNWQNYVNFGGEEYMPSSDAILGPQVVQRGFS